MIVHDLELPSDSKKAKERLVKDGIEFINWDGEPDIFDENCLRHAFALIEIPQYIPNNDA